VTSDRVVLARRDPLVPVGFQWTGREPDGLYEVDLARALGAIWEGDELVTYDLAAFTHTFRHYGEEYLADPD
jgi:hypothetical protein